MTEALGHLRALVANTPWSGDYDNDWCHFCYGQPTYEPKRAWTGHREDCVWLAASEWLNALAPRSGATEDAGTPNPRKERSSL